MSNSRLIAIIIPVFNAQDLIVTCLHSIQIAIEKVWDVKCISTCPVEVICINDGSTDETLTQLLDYAAIVNWLRVCDQNNSGVSAARNRGLIEAGADYIAFVDADDTVAENYFSESFKWLKLSQYDCVCFGINIVHLNGVKEPAGSYPSKPVAGNGDDFCQAILNPKSGYQGYCVNKMVRRDFLTFLGDKGKFDTSVFILEDEWFWVRVAPLCSDVLFLGTSLYDYNVRLDGATSIINNDRGWSDLEMRYVIADYVSDSCPSCLRYARWRVRLKICSIVRRAYVSGDAESLARIRKDWRKSRHKLFLPLAPISLKRKCQVLMCDAAICLHIPLRVLRPVRKYLVKDNERIQLNS